jgi:hypothetical protein
LTEQPKQNLTRVRPSHSFKIDLMKLQRRKKQSYRN